MDIQIAAVPEQPAVSAEIHQHYSIRWVLTSDHPSIDLHSTHIMA